MRYISTRNKNNKVSGPEAVVKGLSDEGGLFVPEEFPKFSLSEIEALCELDYPARAAEVIYKFMPELTKEGLLDYTSKAYSRFDGDAAPLVKIDENLYILELWHGPTHAFKDIALTLLPYLMTGSKKKLGHSENTLILVATSGDTGKAALEGFKDVDGTDVIVFYPQDGVSQMQKLQMMTTTGGNVKVFGINGNFDDAQSAVKKIFTDKETADIIGKSGYNLSSANSINWGRLVPQIAYYFSSYCDMLSGGQIALGDKVNFCVPSGNFGNILAGYYAMQMGLPVNRLICASNKNNVLTDFISGGEYSVKREFYKTTSPSMDILISSNLERLLFELSGRNDTLIAERMQKLKTDGVYSVTESELKEMQKTFYAGYSDEDTVFNTVGEYFDEYGYVLDTHTSVAASVYAEYVAETADNTPTVIVSTASPYKFVDDVLCALGEKKGKDAKASLKKLEDVSAMPVPETLSELFSMPVLHKDVIDKGAAKEAVINYCQSKGNK